MAVEQVLMTTTDTPLSLAVQINNAHGDACRAAQTAIAHARRAGQLLIEAKAELEHGSWLAWLGEHCPTIPERTAQAYMRVARDWPTLEAKAQHVADLPLRDALALLAEPRDDEPAADTEEMPTLVANPTADELLAWIKAMSRRTDAADLLFKNDLEAHGPLPTPDTAEGWMVCFKETDEFLRRAIRLKLEQQHECVLVFDAISAFDAATPTADWRAEIDADTARLTAFLTEMKGAGVS